MKAWVPNARHTPCDFRLLLDAETTKIAWCVRTKDDRRSLILQTRQLLDRFENRIGPTTVAWCVRVKDILRINRPIPDQSVQNFRDALLTQIRDPLSVKMAQVDAEHKTWARPATGYGDALLGKTACSTGYGVIIIGLLK